MNADLTLSERDRQIEAGKEMAAMQSGGSPSVLEMFRVMQKWNVETIIFPPAMGDTVKPKE